MVVAFELDGQDFNALNGGPLFTFNESISFVINCADQAEIDRLWDALIADGGKPGQCGWLKDKYGVSWQVVHDAWQDMLSGPDAEKSNRAMQAVMGMTKLDMAAIQAAYDGL